MKVGNVHLNSAAIHEAAHAVAALQVGRYVGFVEISLNAPGRGLTRFAMANETNPFLHPKSVGAALAAWNWESTEMKREMKIMLAGSLAEAKALGKPLRVLGAKSDLNRCIRLAGRLDRISLAYSMRYPLKLTPACKVMNNVRRTTRKWVSQPRVWQMIVAVSEGLVEAERLYGSDICHIIGKANEDWAQKVIDLR